MATAVLLAACGGDAGPTGTVDPPPPPPPPPPPAALVMGVDSARPREFVTLRPTGLGRAVPDTVTGVIGTVPFRAIRLDDSTLVGLVPTGATGSQTVRFVVHGRPFTAQMVLVAPVTAADPAAAALTLFDRALARFDSVAAALDAGVSNGVDTAAVRRFAIAGRATVAQAKADFLALTPAERSEAAPYILAEAASVGLEVGTGASASVSAPFSAGRASPGGPRLALASASSFSVCTVVTSFQNCAQLGEARTAIAAVAVEIARCSAKTIGTSAVGGAIGGAVGGAIGFFAGGIGAAPGAIAGIKNGAALGAGLGLGWCMSDVWVKLADVYDAAVKPVLVSVQATFRGSPQFTGAPGAGPRGAGVRARFAAPAATEAGTYTTGVAQQVDVYVEFRSLSAEDANGPPALASLVQQFNQLSRSWDAIRAKFSVLDAPAITLPASPRVSIQKKVPGSFLSVQAVTPAPITAVSSGTDDWRVTFSNPPQGDDLNFSYVVRFAFANFPDQERTLSGLLRPSRYTVAGLTLTPAVDTVMVGQSATITWAASDSSGDVLTDSLLAGRRPTWSSESPNVATVGVTSGAVKGVSGGTAGITAELETGRATMSVLSVPDITGTYTLVTENGVAVPGVTFEDDIYRIETSAGSVTLRADGTFGYSRSAIGTNLATGKKFNEGGSGGGTYTVNESGTAITFETTEQEGTPITFGSGGIHDGTLSVSVQSPEGAGGATLQKQP
ncbi:MAG TPA: hypothetical protein VHQ45_03965 [Gemmatimonadaceae bacterium]|nr:hypothetical protein [Gemmatimonadaceae bacterium]